jgi:hypothetical protein
MVVQKKVGRFYHSVSNLFTIFKVVGTNIIATCDEDDFLGVYRHPAIAHSPQDMLNLIPSDAIIAPSRQMVLGEIK